MLLRKVVERFKAVLKIWPSVYVDRIINRIERARFTLVFVAKLHVTPSVLVLYFVFVLREIRKGPTTYRVGDVNKKSGR